MDPATLLEEAILFSVRAHMGQKHVFGFPYILHPLRVMNRVQKAGGSLEAMTVAVLHDTIEDTETTIDTLDGLFGSRIAGAVGILSRPRFVSYTDYVTLIGDNRYRDLTVIVKLADLADNLQLGKDHPLPKGRQEKLNERYQAARKYLNSIPNTKVTTCD